MTFEELEYKYRADSIKLIDFKDLMNLSVNKVDEKSVASWDVYYHNPKIPDGFQRLRKSPLGWELTTKVKTQLGNNWVRLESDLPLDATRVSEEQVTFDVGLRGYTENFRIFKHCDVYYWKNVNFVYYVVFDEHFEELGRYIEVEVNKDWLSGKNLDLGMIALREGEIYLEKLGITPQNRLKKSLFELYKRT